MRVLTVKEVGYRCNHEGKGCGRVLDLEGFTGLPEPIPGRKICWCKGGTFVPQMLESEVLERPFEPMVLSWEMIRLPRYLSPAERNLLS